MEELLADAFVELDVSDVRESFDVLAGWLDPDDEVSSGDDSWAVDELGSAAVS